ncbi:MAG: hypothetical protein ABEJ60_00855 [Halodesulfurarchaeum sp.]
MAGVDRGVSTVVGYVLNIGIATILIAGLLIAGTGLVADQRERIARTELEVLGNRIAANLETADRLPDDGTVTVRMTLPKTVLGSSYRVHIHTADGAVTIRLTMTDPAVVETVPVANESRVKEATVPGGPILIHGNNGTLVVRDG